MDYLKSVMICLCTILLLVGCSSKDMKQFGGNMMTTTGGGSPIGAIIGVSLGGAIYGMGALAENEEEDKILAQRQSATQEVKTDTNSTLSYMSTLIESKDISTTKDNISELDENISK